MPETPHHAGRDHATWSASASDRLWGCAGSLAMEQNAGVPDVESHAAAWGTAAHEVAEIALRGDGNCLSSLGITIKTKQHEIVVDEEVCETAQMYVDYVLGRVAEEDGCDLLIEQKFDLASLKPPFGAGGTGDAVLLCRESDQIEIVDLKGGRGVVVEALNNKQLRTYGLGAVLANPGRWRQVRVTVVQPRAPHPDGRIRSETFDIVDLFDWTVDLLEAMQTSYAAQMDFGKPGFAETHLTPGDHCTFCRAAPVCPALQEKALVEAQVFFKPHDGNEITTPPEPATLPMEKIVRILDHADMITGWINQVRAYAQNRAEAGYAITDGHSTYQLVPKQARRKWKADDAAVLVSLALETGRGIADFQNEPKTMSPAQVEKVLGKKAFAEIESDLVDKSSSGLNLVRSDKTNRPAVLPPVMEFFKPQE